IIAYHSPAMAHPDAASLEVLAGIFAGRGGTGRVDKALVDTKKAGAVGVSLYEIHEPGVGPILPTLNAHPSLGQGKKNIFDTIASLTREAPTKEEVDRAKTRVIQGMDRTFANSQQLAMPLTDVIADGDWRLLFANYEEIKRVTDEDVTQVAKTYFKDSNR